MNSKVLWIFTLYLVAISLPGLFGIQANSSFFILFQIACFSVLLVSIALYALKQDKALTLPVTGVRFTWIYVGLLTIACLYAMMLALQNGGSFASMAQFFLPAMLAFIFLIGFGKTRIGKSEIDKFLVILLALTTASSVYNIIINFQDIVSIASITGSYQVDFKGFFYNRNVFGYMMAAGIACGLYLWTQQRKMIYLIAIAILAVSLFAAMSRGGILFIGIFSLVFFLSQAKSKILGVLAGLVILIPLLIFSSNQAFIQNNIIRSDNADTGRSGLREIGMRQFLQGNMIFGNGQKAITDLEERRGNSSYHNLYIEALATQGLIGLAVVFLGIGYAYNRIKKVKQYYKSLGSFFIAFLVAYVVYIFIEALPLFYATPNSILTTYIIILLPMLISNSLLNPSNKAHGESHE